MKEIRLELRKVGSELQEAYDKAHILRQDFLMYLASKQQSEGLPSAKAIKAIAKEEKMTATFADLRRAWKQLNNKQTIRLQVPSSSSSIDDMWDILKTKNTKVQQWSEVEEETKKEDLLLKWSARHYSQADSSPFASSCLSKLLDNDYDIVSLLKGSFDAHMHQEEVQQFLSMMSIPPQTRPLESRMTLSFDSFKKYFKKIKESKATSPSGTHLGISKTAVEHEVIAKVLFDIVFIAFQNHVVLDRWRQTSIILLPKESDSYHIHRFRHITLLESDLQWLIT